MSAMLASWLRRLRRRLPNRVLALAILRGLVIVASLLWLAFAPPDLTRPGLLAAVLAAFAVYGAGLYALLWFRTEAILRLNFVVLCVDLAFALAIIHLTGGARSVFFLALYLIAALQSYYYGTRRGVGVAISATGLYLAVIWPGLEPAHWADYALRGGLLLLTAVGLGILSNLEEQERQEAQALNRELGARERFIRDVVASLRDGLVILDCETRITGWNRAMEARYEIPAARVLGRRFFEAFPNFAREGLDAVVDRVIAGEDEGFTLESFPHDTLHRGRVILNLKGGAIRGADGALQGLVLLVEDITERVGLEQSLRQADKLAGLGTLAAGLAHELNNPIGVMTSRIELILEDAEALGVPQEVRRDLAVLRTHADRVARITQGLLSFARQGPAVKGPVDLNQVVEDMILLVAKQAQKDGIELRVELASGLPAVLGDPTLLGQVLLNLVNNAREALAGAGEIMVRTEPDPMRPGWARLIVRDTGVGIPADQLGRIFDPFFTTKATGTGLGLAMSYGIVREHGGLIGVESRPGEGATFVLSLPGAAEASAGGPDGKAER